MFIFLKMQHLAGNYFLSFFPSGCWNRKYFQEEIKTCRTFPSEGQRLSAHGVSGARSQSFLVAAIISLTWDSISLKSI